MDKLAVDIGSKFGSPFGQTRTLSDLVTVIIGGGFAIASVIVVLLIISGGIMIISGAGSNDPDRVAKGKQAVTWAIIGFIIVFVAYWIVRVIELVTGDYFITNPVFF